MYVWEFLCLIGRVSCIQGPSCWENVDFLDPVNDSDGGERQGWIAFCFNSQKASSLGYGVLIQITSQQVSSQTQVPMGLYALHQIWWYSISHFQTVSTEGMSTLFVCKCNLYASNSWLIVMCCIERSWTCFLCLEMKTSPVAHDTALRIIMTGMTKNLHQHTVSSFVPLGTQLRGSTGCLDRDLSDYHILRYKAILQDRMSWALQLDSFSRHLCNTIHMT